MKHKITDSELEVMRLLWRKGRPLSFTEIRTELENSTKWSKSTIQTLLVRLRDKGTISTKTEHVTLYSPNITEQEYEISEGKSFLDRVFNGNAKKLVVSLFEHGQLSERDIDELRQLFIKE